VPAELRPIGSTIDASLATIANVTLTNALLENSIIRNGSEIDDSPIGNLTPSTGKFTTLKASSAPVDPTDVVRKTDLETATGSLGTMSTQDADSVAITGGTIDGVTLSGTMEASAVTFQYPTIEGPVINDVQINSGTIDDTTIGATTPSTGAFTTLNANSLRTAGNIDLDNMGEILNVNRIGMAGNIDFESLGRVINLNDPVDAQDAATKNYVNNAVSVLGSVFHYVGDLSANIVGTSLATLTDGTTGAYYKVDVAGAYTDGATTFNAKVGDAFVKTSTGWQKIDNVDVVVSGTANEISVTGDENAGYTVALAGEFKDKVTLLETKTQNIDHTGTSAGITDFGFSELTNVAAVYSPDILHLNAATELDLIAPVQINVNAPIMKGDVAAPTTLENFIIDGGVY